MDNDGLIHIRTPAGVRALFTTRHGGMSDPPYDSNNLGRGTGDRDNAIRENRRGLCASLGIDADVVHMQTQVHGTHVADIREPTEVGRFLGELTGWPEGDGLVTSVLGLPLMVLVADCVPILMWSDDGRRVGAVHAGWRGLVDGIVRNGVRAMNTQVPLGAAIGPCAGLCCYQVDDGLRRRFMNEFGPQVVAGDRVDLAGAARHALVQAGIADAAIVVQGGCTICDPGFFSHRRDGARTGRQAGLIWRQALS